MVARYELRTTHMGEVQIPAAWDTLVKPSPSPPNAHAGLELLRGCLDVYVTTQHGQ